MNQNFELKTRKIVRRVIAEWMGVKHDLLVQTLIGVNKQEVQ